MIYFVTNQTSIGEYKNIEKASVQDVIDAFSNKEEIQVDTETEGFDPYTKNLLLLQLGDYDNQYVIDATTVDVRQFKELLENKTIFLHNAKFDLRFLYHKGIFPFENVYDTYLAERVISTGIDSHRKSLEACCQRYLKVSLAKEVRGMMHRLGHYDSRVIEYAANDVKYLQAIRDHQMRIIKENNLINALNLDNIFVSVLAYMEYCGIKLDVEKWKEKAEQDKEKLAEKEDILNKLVKDLDDPRWLRGGDLFNPDPVCNILWTSPKQVIPLFKSFGLNLTVIDKKTGNEKDSIEEKVIKPYKDKHPIIKAYLEWSKQEKLVSTYGDSFLKHVNPVTGRIHTNFTQILNTGRLSSGKDKEHNAKRGEVNMQNIPRTPEQKQSGKIYERECFIPEKNNVFATGDYSGQETRVLAELSGDHDYLIYSTEKDLHSFSAKLLYPEISELSDKEVKTLHKDKRQKAKSISFAIPYGGNGATIAMNLSLPIKRGEEIYNAFLSRFPHLKNFFEKSANDAINNGYVLINKLTGRRSYAPQYDLYISTKERLEAYSNAKRSGNKFKGLSSEFWKVYTDHKQKQTTEFDTLKALVSRYFKLQGSMGRSGQNYIIQGTSAEMTKLAMIYIYRWIRESDLLNTVKIVLQVHDEIVLEGPSEMGDIIGNRLVECMVKAGKVFCPTVPMKVDYEVGEAWEH